VSIKWDNENFDVALELFALRLNLVAQTSIERITELAASVGRINAQHVFSPNKKGRLEESIRATPVKKIGNLWTGGVQVSVIYARIQEIGGEIVPVRAAALRFESPAGSGNFVFAKRVHLPARPYMRPAWRTAKKGIPILVRKSFIEQFGV
jgi:hypothetical protein